MVKSLPAMQETWARFLGQEHPLEKGMATHSSILSWRIPRTEKLGGLQPMGWQRVGHGWATNGVKKRRVHLRGNRCFSGSDMSTAPPGGNREQQGRQTCAGQTARVPSFKQGFKLPNSSNKKKRTQPFPTGPRNFYSFICLTLKENTHWTTFFLFFPNKQTGWHQALSIERR